MHNPELFVQGNGLHYRDTSEMISKYLNVENWKGKGEILLDIGCGPANNTWELLRPHIPEGTKILGADISEKMVEYASRKYPDLGFFCLDITTKNIHKDLIGFFDHVYSTFCLHWALDQRHVMRNVHKLLKPGGDLFTCYCIYHPFYDIMYDVASLPKWKKYIQNPRVFADFGKDHHSIEQNLKDILEDVGFDVSICEVITRKYTHPDKKDLENMLNSVNPYLLEIPQSLTQELLEETLHRMYKTLNIEDGKEYVMTYDVVVISATKSH